MKNSRWQINRVGLIDFWYYDMEEFYFLDGRMLLRGANGSGKSVTMQSFIPLLLDGNMRPERLDPFGSRARKMENYLLEEGDEREERTGYLYMEMKREENQEYLTLGIGMRARKNKKMESWYFCITDNRRIGKDLYLYKDEVNKIVCTRRELKNRIGDGGRVMDTQSDYAACVNHLLFGFETQEEYRELLELLIQLRTPKLSKEFKPSVINDILSSSLQTLTEDDLRPMSEAIENMDSLKTNMDTLNESVRAARQIERIYKQYNEMMLGSKAFVYTEALKECLELERKQEDLKKDEVLKGEELEKEQIHYDGLKREENVLTQERNSLSESDAARLKEQEQTVQAEAWEYEKNLTQKQRQETEKEERRLDIEDRREGQIRKNEETWEQIEVYLEDMEAELEDIPFDEAVYFRDEIRESADRSPSFPAHIQLLNEYTRKVEAGKQVLEEEKNCQERYDRKLKELDELYARRKDAEKELQQRENLLYEIKNELRENVFRWEKQNTELHMPREALSEIVKGIDEFQMGMDFSEIRDRAKAYFYERERALSMEKMEDELQKKKVEEKAKALEEELELWRTRKEPEPELEEAVRKNRELLKEKKIPFTEFYKAVDFEAGLDTAQMSALEEALERMGLLNALIVSPQYREAIRKLDEKVCDRYIFTDAEQVQKNLNEWLYADHAEDDILFCQEVFCVLSAIGFADGVKDGEMNGSTWIDEKGYYKIGVLEGTISGSYEAKYIGSSAREAYKQRRILELEAERIALLDEIREWEKKLRILEERLRVLNDEWEAFPSDEDLKIAARDCAQAMYELENINRLLKQQQELTEEERKVLAAVRLRVREICEKCFMNARLDLFTNALQALGRYKEYLMDVKGLHSDYLNGRAFVRSQEERLEEMEIDLDNIRYEIGQTERKLREIQAQLLSIQEQLRLTDYEQIRVRLDHCIRRLSLLPAERETSVRVQADLRGEMENLREKQKEYEQELEEKKEQKERFERAFEAEYNLNYVDHPFAGAGSMEKIAEKICGMYAGRFGTRKLTDLTGSLQEVYHQNRGALLEYQLTMQTLFEEMDEENNGSQISMKRIDILAKYRGAKVRFPQLIEKLAEDAEELARLLSDKDRELFEDILANTVSKKIRGKIQSSKRWIEKMNGLMEAMQTSSGLKLNLKWKHKRAEKEEQLDTRELVELLQKDVEIMREDEVEKLSGHFRSKIEDARKLSGDVGSMTSFHAIMREVLDYRKWFEFQLECQKIGEKKKEMTDKVFFAFSGGEKAMAMYVPLFSAVVAKYAGGRKDAPRLISLDEAFAGVDATNIRDMFRLMVEFEFNFMINSQVLWGDCDTVPALAIYQLIRPMNAKFVTVIPYKWNGNARMLVENMEEEIRE